MNSIIRTHVADPFPFVRKHVPLPIHRSTWKPTKEQGAAMTRYRAAYKSAYSMEPEICFDGTWCRITGQTARVSMKRLRELTRQLEYRNG